MNESSHAKKNHHHHHHHHQAVRDRHEYIKGNTAAVVMREYEMELLGYVGDCYDEMNLGEEHECDNAEGSDDDDEMIEMECDE